MKFLMEHVRELPPYPQCSNAEQQQAVQQQREAQSKQIKVELAVLVSVVLAMDLQAELMAQVDQLLREASEAKVMLIVEAAIGAGLQCHVLACILACIPE